MSPPTEGKLEDDEPNDTQGVILTAAGKPHKPPSKIACVGCRAIKVKCRLPNGEIPTGVWEKDQHKCTRCDRLKIPCEYKSAPRRGRKPKDRSLLAQSTVAASDPGVGAGDDLNMLPFPPQSVAGSESAASFFPPPPPIPSTSSAPPPTSAWPAQASVPSPYLGYGLQQQSPFLPHLAPQPAIALHPPTFPAPPPPRPQPHATQSSPAHSLPSLGQPSPASVASGGGSLLEHPALSLAEAAETRASTFTKSKLSLTAPRLKKTPAKQPDPVDLHVLSQLEASQLIDHFHKFLNPYIILLDHHLHTAEYVRSTSTVLYTAMLAVSAKFFRQDLYPSLLLSAQQLVTRCMGGDGELDIGLVQACLLCSYWKEPFDSSAWLKIGFAIRLAYQLRLHHKRKGPLPANEHEARVLLDRERTWITLVCFDNSYILSDDHDSAHETRMITLYDIDIDAWLNETRMYDVPDDAEQGASIELCRVWRLCRNIVNAGSKATASMLATHLSAMLAETHRKYLDVHSPHYILLNPQAAHKVRFHWRSASVSLGRACLIAAGISDQNVLADFLRRASELVECFEEMAKEGLLRFLQDLIAMTMLSFGEFLGKLFAQVNSVVQTGIVKCVSQVYTAASRAKDGNEDGVAAFIARFYRAVLTAIRGPGALPETRPPTPGGPGAEAYKPFEQLGGMESELFTDIDTLVAELNRDNSYWDSINSAQANSSWTWLDQALLQPQDGGPPPPLL
ncbi:hypothetical protein JCM10207_004062 [Rhodosporidiobolus poonsookiae]